MSTVFVDMGAVAPFRDGFQDYVGVDEARDQHTYTQEQEEWPGDPPHRAAVRSEVPGNKCG
ncbi:hypothetical protein [Acidipila rosea]|uniref:hypothetical protein n=1 Tax=Acidipila rosea TaxID=768535 RepID=UPI001A9DD862|nr:hypothetical protein [Acidipila rosea]